MKQMRGAALAAALTTMAFAAEAGADGTRRTPALPSASCLPPPDGAKAMQAAEAPPPPVLMDGLGYAGLEPDSTNPEARAWFAQGVRLIWAFDEVEAVRAFQQAQRLDPACALCHFGEAWARGPTINLNPRTSELAAARAAARRALAMVDRLSPRDQVLVRAQALRTSDGDDFAGAAYAAYLETAALRMPQDDTLQIMAADARMVAWGRGQQPPVGSLAQLFLERVLARNPEHGGAIHYYIHLTDWIDRQHLAVPYADRLGRIAPAASHLVHMPSHTYYGVGRYRDAAAVNVAAIAADRAFNARANPVASDYRFYLNRHNMHFAINAALARGDGATALAVSEQYRAAYLGGANVQQGSRLLGSALSYAAGLYRPLADIPALPESANVVDRAMRHYARGEALARSGDAAAVSAEARAIAALREGAAAPGLGRGGARLAEVAQGVLEGRAAMLERRYDAAATAYRRAMNAQLAADFGMDPPLFWYSVRRSLAAALLASGDADGARAQLYASLRRWPSDPLALYTLSLADRAMGDEARAAGNLARARAVWAGDVTQVPLSRI
jgi:tetratricopeptide (TPR) repeat protein